MQQLGGIATDQGKVICKVYQGASKTSLCSLELSEAAPNAYYLARGGPAKGNSVIELSKVGCDSAAAAAFAAAIVDFVAAQDRLLAVVAATAGLVLCLGYTFVSLQPHATSLRGHAATWTN